MSDNGKQLGKLVTPGLRERSPKRLRLRDERVRRMLRELCKVADWLKPADMPIARRFCETEVLVSRVWAVLCEFMKADGPEGLLHRTKDGDVTVRMLVENHRRLCQTQSRLADRLGLTPASRAAIRAGKGDAYIDIDVVTEEQAERALAMARGPAPTGSEVVEEGHDSGKST